MILENLLEKGVQGEGQRRHSSWPGLRTELAPPHPPGWRSRQG